MQLLSLSMSSSWAYSSLWIFIILIFTSNFVHNRKMPLFLSNSLSCMLMLLLFSQWQSSLSWHMSHSVLDTMSISNSVIMGLTDMALSFYLVILFLSHVVFAVSWNMWRTSFRIMSLLASLLALFLCWTSLSPLNWYFTYELSLIPLSIVLLHLSPRERGQRASSLMLGFTILSGVALMAAVIVISGGLGSVPWGVYSMATSTIPIGFEYTISILVMFTLVSKLPLVPFHIWLPEAHVESTTLGSVLLAGLMLKLGVVGMVRLLLPMKMSLPYIYPLFTAMVLSGIIYTSLSVLRQVDLKRMVAYASIGHMSMMALCVMWHTHHSYVGGLSMALSHGIVSPGMFLMTGVLSDNLATRVMSHLRGLADLMSTTTFTFIILMLANCSMPGTISFLPEFYMLSGLATYSIVIPLMCTSSVALSATYSIWILSRISLGMPVFSSSHVSDISPNTSILLFTCGEMSLSLGVMSTIILNSVNLSYMSTLYVSKMSMVFFYFS